MKTLNLHTIAYQPTSNLMWAGNRVCDFSSKGIKNQLGATILNDVDLG
jgi:hypothetical protein